MEVISGWGITVRCIREITIWGVCVCVCVCAGSGLNPACVWRRGRSWGTGQDIMIKRLRRNKGRRELLKVFIRGEAHSHI